MLTHVRLFGLAMSPMQTVSSVQRVSIPEPKEQSSPACPSGPCTQVSFAQVNGDWQ
jgi:hypothetical protein